MKSALLILSTVLCLPTVVFAGDRMLFTFDRPDSASRWRAVNDTVMGGRSDGRFKINDQQQFEFYGNLSLENNGGFASVRSRGGRLGLVTGDTIVAKVRGDGRKYSMSLYTPQRRMAFSYRASFQTKPDEWMIVRLPLDKFVATSFGRVLPGRQLDPRTVVGIGLFLGDKKPGPFELEVDWIKATQTDLRPVSSGK
ncbi:MAG: CIA30 family protein [Pirellulaceae bacterium]|nr:CIA30 family protein [Pirellulaceae bacterium]